MTDMYDALSTMGDANGVLSVVQAQEEENFRVDFNNLIEDSTTNDLGKDKVYELFDDKKGGRCAVCTASHRGHCGTPKSDARCHRRQQNQLNTTKVVSGEKKKEKPGRGGGGSGRTEVIQGDREDRDSRSDSPPCEYEIVENLHASEKSVSEFESNSDSGLLEDVLELLCSSSGRKRQKKEEEAGGTRNKAAKKEKDGAQASTSKAKAAAVVPKEYSEDERCRMKELKSQVLSEGGDDLLNTCNWIAHMAESPTSLLMDYLKTDAQISKFKSTMEGLRLLRLEKILQRRQGLRPASGRSLTLVPFHHRREASSIRQETSSYPHRESRVGGSFQAVVPELRPEGAKPLADYSDREDPILVWPNQVLGPRLVHDPLKTKRILLLLSDPINYEWTSEECSLFKHALEEYGKDFAKICKCIKESAPHSKKTARECVAFYYTVWKTKPT